MTRKEGRSHAGEDNRHTLFTRYINMWIVSLDVSIQRYHWQPLSVHFELTVPTQPMMSMKWHVVRSFTTPLRSRSPTLFEQCCGFFYVPQEPVIMLTAVRRNVQFFVLIREDCRKSNYKICRWLVITKTALSSQLFKDPECCSGWGLNPWPSTQQTCALST